jgi:hypothetical protein
MGNHNIKIEASWDLILDINTDANIEILVDRFKHDFPEKGDIRILILMEPTMALVSDVMSKPRCYTHVLTYHEDILANNPRSTVFNGTTTWVDPYKEREKKFCVSTVVGAKKYIHFPGYAKRRELWNRQGEITIPKDFYLSGNDVISGVDYSNNLVLGDYKDVMFDCQYHVAIENAYMKNFFTEKLIDCFLSYTIPIFIGAPNVGDFFNLDGMYVCETINDVIDTINGLTPEIYEQKIDAINENYNTAMGYTDFASYTTRKINDILGI